MNCSVQMDLLSSLLWFLTSQLPYRSFILYSDAPEAAALAKAMREHGRFLLSLQGTVGASRLAQPSHTMFIRVYLGKYFHEKIVTGFGSISLFVTNGCIDAPRQYPDDSEKVLVAELGGRSCCYLRQMMRTLPGTPDDVRLVAFFDPRQQRWLLDHWPREKSPLSTPLPDVELKLALSTSPQMTNEEVVERYSQSLGKTLWTILQDHFQIRLVLEVVPPPSDPADPNFIQNTLTEFKRGRYDALGDVILISPERVQALELMLVGLEVKYHFIIRQPEYEFSWLALGRPLATVTWFTIVVMVIVVGLVLNLIFTRAPDCSDHQGLSSNLFLAYGFCCCQAHLGTLKSLSLQIACVASLLCFYAVNQFYVSNLYSILSTREIHYPFNSIEEFTEKQTHRLIMHQETSAYAAFQSAEDGVLRTMWENFLRDDPHHGVISRDTAMTLQRLCDGSSAAFALPTQVLPLRTLSCPLHAVPTGYFPTPMCLAAKKKFIYLRHFRALFHRATEAGVSSVLKQKYLKSHLTPLKKTDLSKQPLPVSLYQVLFLFLMLGSAVVISSVVLLLEILYFRRSRSISRY